MRLLGWLIAALALAGGILLLDRAFPSVLEQEGNGLRLVAMLGCLALVSIGVVRRRRTILRDFGHLLLWLAVFSGLILGYSYRDEAVLLGARLKGELLAGTGRVEGPASVSFPLGDDGHFHVNAEIDGTQIQFLVDSGASDIVLTLDDARRLGFDPSQLGYTRLAGTANGTVRGAPVKVGTFAVGPIHFEDLELTVNEAPMSHSLLGMDFLNRLSGWSVAGRRLTLER